MLFSNYAIRLKSAIGSNEFSESNGESIAKFFYIVRWGEK